MLCLHDNKRACCKAPTNQVCIILDYKNLKFKGLFGNVVLIMFFVFFENMCE